MKQLSLYLTFLLGLIVFANKSYSQCTVQISPATVTIDCGESVDLSALGLSSTPALSTNFNGNSIGAGWQTSATLVYTNPCGPTPDGTASAWFGNVPLPRTLTTNGFDLQCGGQVCFDLDFSGDENATNCEDPDEADEGVFFQYSIDGGTTWIDLNYFDPVPNYTAGTNPVYSWNTYCFTLPPGAWSPSTMFQWDQPNATSSLNDHWGIDNVVIIPSDCSYWYDWDNIVGSNDPTDQTVTPATTTTYNVTYTNGIDACNAAVTVNVNPLVVDATTTDAVVCPGNCADLDLVLQNPPTNICNETATATGGDNVTDVTINSFPCVPAGATITGVIFDGTYSGTVCPSWYDWDLIINGVTVSTGNCGNVTGMDLSGFIPITSVTMSSNDNDNFTDNITMNMTLNITYTTNPVYNYSWTPAGSLNNANIQSPTACPTATTTYTGTLTEINSGCTATDNITVGVSTLTVSPDVTICNGGSTNLAATGVSACGGATSYSWSPATGLSNANISNPVASPTTTTTYTVSFNDGCGCTLTENVVVTVTTVTPTFDPIAAVCQNAAAPNLLGTSTNGITGTWSPAVSTATAGTTTYTFTPNAGQCATTTTLDITVDPQVTPTFTPIAAVCQNAAAPVLPTTSNNGIAGTWSSAVSTATAGTTTYTFTPNAGLCATTTTLDITVNPNPVPTATADSVNCNGGTDGSVTVTGIVGTSAFPGGYGYSWNSAPVQTTQTATGLGIGTYTVTVTDLTTTCTGQTTATIFEPTPLTATNTPTNPTCAQGTNGSITANPSGGTGTYTYLWTPGSQTTQTATGLSSGINYICTITDENNCTTTTSATLTDPAGMVLSTSMNQANCGASDGDATVTVVSGGSGTFTYSWNTAPVQNTATAIGIPAGTYIATVNDVTLGCTSTDTIIVTTTTGITATATFVSDALCNGSNDGVAYAVPTGGSPGYTYLWDDISGSTNDTLFAAAGTYNVTITDTNGCTGTDFVTINEPTVVIASITSSTAEVCLGANNGTATAGGAQGTGGYTYSWNTTPVQTTQTATGLAPGTYVVTVFDDNLCSDTASVVINSGPSLTVSHTSTDVSCFNGTNGTIDVTVGGAPGPITYAWTPSGGASEDPVGLTAGTYYLTATSLGCTVNDTVEIFEPTQLVAAIDSSFDALCFGETNGIAYGSATGGTSPYTYFWGAASGGQTTAAATGLGAGNYTLIVTDSNNCNATVPVVINEPAALNAVLGSFDAYCGLDQGTVWVQPTNGTAPYVFAWDSAGTPVGALDTINGLFPGDYALNITDANNCKFNGTVTVNAAVGGVAGIASQTDVSCNGGADGTATVSVGGAFPGYTYLWDAAAGNQTTNPGINLSAGLYSVDVTDNLGCVMTTTVTIGEPTPLTTTMYSIDKFCADSCNGSAGVTPSGGTAPYFYVWQDPTFQTTQLANGLCAGDISVIVTDTNGCSISDTITIANPPKMVLTSSTDSSSCNQADGNAYVSVVANGNPPFTYEWTDGTNILSSDSSLLGVAAGTYYGFAFDSLGCSVIDTVTIYDLSAPQIDSVVINHVLCNGDNTGSAEVFVSGGAYPYTYLWNDGAAQTTPVASNLTAGGYTVNVQDTNGCIISAPANVTQPAALVLTSGGINPSCADSTDGSVWVNAQGGVQPYTYEWNSNPLMANDTIYNIPEIAGGYSVLVTDANNCTEIANVVLVDPPLFTINVSGIDVSCFGGNNGSATVSENNGVAPFSYAWNDPSTQTAQTASGLVANTYNVVATDDAGCTANGSIIINEPNELILTLDTVVNVSCNGLADGFAQVDVVGGSGAYSFTWTLGATVVSNLQNPVGLAAGLYAVVVTDTAGCTDQINVNVTEPAPLSSNVIANDARCFGQNSGFAYAIPNGGTAPYTYQWDDLGLQQTDTAFNLLAGNYNLVVTDTLGCTFNVNNIIIGEPTEIVLNSSTISSSCGSANGTASVAVGGGVSPYNFVWNDPGTQANAVATGLFAGGYQVIVTDAQGCKDSVIANVVDQGSPVVVIDSITNVSCNGAADGMAYASVNGGTAPYQYSWNNANGDTTLNASNLDAQSYTITVTDDNGCVTSADTVIQENAGVVVVANVIQNVSCNGGADGIVYSNGNGGTGQASITYSWNTIPVQANDTASGLIAGIYVVTATDLNNCTATDTVTVTEPAPLTTTLDSLKNLTCFESNDGYIDVTGNGGTLPYTWTSNAVGGPTLSGLAAGDYYLIVTDAKGCIDSTNYTLTQPNELIIAEVTTASTCGNFNGSSEVTSVTGGTGPYTYSWNDPQNQQTALADSLLANTYTVVVTDFNGCTIDTTVVVLNTPGSTIDSVVVVDVDCYGNNTGSAQAFVTGTAPFTYTWTPSGQLTAQASSLTAGVYSVEVVDGNGCITTQSGISVNQPSQLSANITIPATACYGQEIQLFGVGSGGTPPYSILWGAPFGVTTPGPLYDTILSPMTYSIAVQDDNGCAILVSETIQSGAPLVITGTGDEVCLGDSAMVFATVSGGNTANGYNYTWSVYDSLTGTSLTPPGVINPTIGASLDVYNTDTTDYIVTVNDGCSRSATAGMSVFVKDTAIVSIISSASGCPIPDYWSIGFEVQNDVWNSTFNWSFGDGGSLISTNDSISHAYYNSGTYDVELEVTTQNGCTSTFIFNDEVLIYQVPEANFTKDPDEVTILNPTYDFSDLSSSDVTDWSWNFGDIIGTSIEQNPSYTYQDTGIYNVQLIVTNGLCEDTIVKKVKVKPEFLFLIPNTFTPQADGLNEIFMPGTMIGVSENDYNFFIYDRWGEMIYEGHDVEDGWDGYYKGELCQTDVYVWYVKLKGIDGLQREYRGHVNLLK